MGRRSRFKNGARMYNLIGPGRSLFLVRPDEEPHGTFPFSFADEISSEWWDDDGGEEWRAMAERLQREGMVLEQGPRL